MRRLCLSLIAALTPIAGLAQAPVRQPPQEPVATFRAGVRAIQVDAVVTDEEGNPVRGLKRSTFQSNGSCRIWRIPMSSRMKATAAST